jgi:hypothetical protein
MNEIPFVDELGDRLQAAINEPSPIAHRRWWRWQRPRSRHGAAIALTALLALTGGGVAVATLLGSGQKLADGSINCFFTTHATTLSAQTLGVTLPSSNGRSAIATCRTAYQLNAHTGIPAASVRFTACQRNATTVSVYVSDDRADQCRRLGDQPLPVTYPAAVHQLHELEASLTRLGERQDCPSPRQLASTTRKTLTQLDLTGWRVMLPGPRRWLNAPAGTGGTCGTFIASSWDNPPASSTEMLSAITPSDHTVALTYGPPRHIAIAIYRASVQLYRLTYQHCFTQQTIRPPIQSAFAPTGMQPHYATTAQPAGEHYQSPSEALYDRGCVRFELAYPGDNNHFVDIWLYARGARALSPHLDQPLSNAFKP